jgi:formylglycine-generating enzyme required for sulfatase activity
MKQIKRILMSAALIALCVTASSCNNAFHDATGATSSGGGGNSGGSNPGGPPGGLPEPVTYREMATLTGGPITGSGGDGVFVDGRTVTLNTFKIAKYETTYQLWKEVRDWAVTKGYTIASEGKEGYPFTGDTNAGKGTDSAEWSAAQKKIRPVTNINWRDAIVWCNAYSEMDGKEPVYYTDASYGTVLKVSTTDGGTATTADTAVMKPGANGYRLPTEAEWEYAARGGNQSNTTVWAYTYAGTSSEGTSTGELGDYAWYTANSNGLTNSHKDYGTHPVGTKYANGANLYDMSGNVWEWCWDWHTSPVDTTAVTNPVWSGDPAGAASGGIRVIRGGSWDYDASACAVAYRNITYPDDRFDSLGFRVVCP